MPDSFAIGTLVRLIGLPAGLQDAHDLDTKSLFEACLGRTFPVVGVDEGRIELHVGEVVGERAFMHSIYVEPEFLKAV